MKASRPKRSVFLQAAEVVHECKIDPYFAPCKVYCCIVIRQYAKHPGRCSEMDENCSEMRMFQKYFYPGNVPLGNPWWPMLYPSFGETKAFDYESRILALLLCAEMLRR